MNHFDFTGRLTRDPEERTSRNSDSSIASFTVAVNRRFKRDGDPDADFFNCVAFGKTAEFILKYFSKGMKIDCSGEIHDNNYTDRNGVDRYEKQVVVRDAEFGESKAASQKSQKEYQSDAPAEKTDTDVDGFMQIPDSISDELPFV